MTPSDARSSADRSMNSPSDAFDKAEDKAENLSDNPWLERAARAGFVMSGVVHMIMGWTAIRISMGAGGDADQSGALRAFTSIPGGQVILGIGAVMMAALAIWYLLDAWFSARRADDTKDALKDAGKGVGKGVVYGALGFTAARFAFGGSSDSGEQSSSVTATVMQMPAGSVIIILVGLVIAGIGGYHIYSGITHRFEKELQGHEQDDVDTTVRVTGTVGYIAKGIALIAVGVLFGWAALQADPEQATGLDGALTGMVALPAGVVLLIAVGVGLIVFGVFCLFRARYAKL